MRAHLEALATEVAAAMARLAIATTAAAKADRRSPSANGGAGAVWPFHGSSWGTGAPFGTRTYYNHMEQPDFSVTGAAGRCAAALLNY